MTTKKLTDQELQERILTLKTGDAWDKRVAAYQLGINQDSRALTALIEALDDEDVNVQERAANALGNLGDSEGFAALAAHLNERAPLFSLMWAMVELDPQRAVKYILPYLQHADIRMKDIAIIALARTKDVEAIHQISEFIHHPDLKRRVISSFNATRDPQAIPILGAALSDKSYRIRLDAVWALSRIRHEQCVPYLIPMLNDIYPPIARIAHKALNAINTPEARAAVQTWRQERYTRKQQYKRKPNNPMA